MRRERGQTWIRVRPMSPLAVCVWTSLGEGRMLCIREDGSHYVTSDSGFRLPKRFGLNGDSFQPGVVERIA